MTNKTLLSLCALATFLSLPACSRQPKADSNSANSEMTEPSQPNPQVADPAKEPPTKMPPLTTDWEYQVVYMVAPGPYARSYGTHKQGMEDFFNRYLGSGGWEYVGVVANRNPHNHQAASVTYTLWRRPRSQPSNYVQQPSPKVQTASEFQGEPATLSVPADSDAGDVAAMPAERR